MSRRPFVIVCLALAVSGLLAGWAVVSSQDDETRTDSESDLGAPHSLEELTSGAPVIVVALAGDAHRVTVDLPSGEGGRVTSRRVDEVRSFAVERVLKQDRAIPEKISVRASVSFKIWDGSEQDATTSEFDEVPVSPGKRYVLFLTTFSATTTGDALGYAGPIAAAELHEDGARFVTSRGIPADGVPAFARQALPISAIEQAILAPAPTLKTPVRGVTDPNSVYASAFARLVEQAPALKSAAEAEQLLTELGMPPGSIEDPLFCKKVEAVVFETSGQRVDMNCR